MSTSTMRSAPAATSTERGVAGVLSAMTRGMGIAWRRAHRFVSTVLFGAEAANALDSRDVDSYFRTTEG